MTNPLHGPITIFSPRHLPSWMLLAFGAGAVNAVAFLASMRFVTHVTGTVTRLGLDVGAWVLLLDYAIVLACFIAGAMASVLALDGRRHRGRRALWSVPLWGVALLLSSVAFAGRLGAFGDFGGAVESAGSFLLLSALAFAMGLQNGAVSTTTGLAVRTTHMTGPATDLGVHLATAYFAQGEGRVSALRGAGLRAGKIAAFAVGAAAAVPLARSFEYLAFLLPAGAVVLATVLSFAESRVRDAEIVVPEPRGARSTCT
ncbi:MAG: DUF1275 domain-containing protein [Deltaproteobacteria bacterium]|nr:DUF1275 domain-containing protein [Deltaproteobacteria bacterium]